MKKFWPLLALAIVAFLLLAIATLPASVVGSRLAKLGILMDGVDGTAWKGRAQVVRLGDSHLGGLEWDMHALALFTGRLKADVKLSRSDGFAQGQVIAALGGRLSVVELSAALPLSAVPSTIAQGGWTGSLNIKLAELALENRWPVRVSGTIEVLELTGPARRPANMGSYRVLFPAGQGDSDTLTGTLTDSGGEGPLRITGRLRLQGSDRSYLIEGLVAPRQTAAPDLVNTLQILGPPDGEGNRPFALEGTL